MALGNNLKKPVQKISKTDTDNYVSSEEVIVATSDVVEEENISSTHHNIDTEEEGTRENLEPTTMMCVFGSGQEEYAIPISLAKEVVKLKQLARIPQMPKHIVGMTNVRGNILGVLDLGIYFGKTPSVSGSGGYLLVVNDDNYKLAIRIPGVPDTLHVKDSQVENINSTMLKSVKKREFLKGIIKKDNRMIVLINIIDMISGVNFVTVNEKSVRDRE